MKATKIIGYILLGAVSAMLLYSVYGKFFGGEMALQMYEALNLGQYRVILGLAEIAAVVLLWMPKHRRSGTLLATGYLGGAIMAELAMGGTGFMSGGTLLALWIGTCLLSCFKKEKCGCKEGCNCDKGVCTC